MRQPNVLPAHTGVRACAALFVVMFHFTGGAHWHGVERLFHRGYLGVDFFFVLSGFIIHHVYGAKIDRSYTAQKYLRFLRYRLARIYPVYFVAMLIAASVSLLPNHVSQGGFTTGGLIAGVFLVHGWFNFVAPNEVSWSVSAEFFAYLLYPVAILGLRRTKIADLVIGVCLLLLMIVLNVYGNANPLLRIIPEFALGAAMYTVSLRYRPNWKWLGLAICVSICVFDLLSSSENLALHAVFFSLVIVSITNPQDILAKALSVAPMIYLGEISYSLYLFHSMVRRVCKQAFAHAGLDPYNPVFMAASIAACIVVAALSYHLVELPARKALRGRSAGIPQETTQVVSPLDLLRTDSAEDAAAAFPDQKTADPQAKPVFADMHRPRGS